MTADVRQQLIELMLPAIYAQRSGTTTVGQERASDILDALLSDEGRPLLLRTLSTTEAGKTAVWATICEYAEDGIELMLSMFDALDDSVLVEYLKERGVLVPAPARLDAGSYLDMTFDAGADLWLLRPPEPGDES